MDVKSIHQAAKDRYWQDKDLAGACRLLGDGIVFARKLNRADLEKPLHYDLASFCWPGWDEANIVIGQDEIELGSFAADENMRLAKELQRGDTALAGAWFLVGAYKLVAGAYIGAYDCFRHQAEHAAKADDEPGKALAEGYKAIARGLALGNLDYHLEPVLQLLRVSGWKHGAELAEQLETAAQVFQHRKRSPLELLQGL